MSVGNLQVPLYYFRWRFVSPLPTKTLYRAQRSRDGRRGGGKKGKRAEDKGNGGDGDKETILTFSRGIRSGGE